VYKNGKLVEDPEEIDWADVTQNGSDYEFKQAPGESNALGKIKFLFNNKSSVYLHDTPTKLPFNKPMRAVSHGCVRLEKPLDLAHVLFGDGNGYQKISKEIGEDNPEPETLSLPKKVPVYITYITCWKDSTGNLQFRPDVYGLDIVLYGHMQRLITAKEPVKAVASAASLTANNKL
jgi:murein L,D-transpeptidase YcbB/YkuD